MAAKPFSKEQLNFFKFSTLVLDEFPKVLREIFITMWNSKVAIKPGFSVWDDSNAVRSMLQTFEGSKCKIPTTKSIEEWDCTALFQATIYAKAFGVPNRKGSTLNDIFSNQIKQAPGSFHSNVQSATGNQDETYVLVIDQLRLLRNTLCHSPKTELSKTDFNNYLRLVTNALKAVNIDTDSINFIGGMNEKDFPSEKVQQLQECRMKELQALSMFREDMTDMKQTLDEIHRMMKKKSDGDERDASEVIIPERDQEVEERDDSVDLGQETNEHAMTRQTDFGDRRRLGATDLSDNTRLSNNEITTMSLIVGVNWDNLAALMDVPYSVREEIRLDHMTYRDTYLKAQRIFTYFNGCEFFSRYVLEKSCEELNLHDVKAKMSHVSTEKKDGQLEEPPNCTDENVTLENPRLSPREMHRLARKICVDWDKLAAHMDIAAEERDNIKFNLAFNDDIGKAEKILSIFNRKKDFSREKLVKFLEEIRRMDLIQPVTTGAWRKLIV